MIERLCDTVQGSILAKVHDVDPANFRDYFHMQAMAMRDFLHTEALRKVRFDRFVR